MDGMLETETDDGDGFWRRILETDIFLFIRY